MVELSKREGRNRTCDGRYRWPAACYVAACGGNGLAAPGMSVLPAGSLKRDAQSSQVRLGKGLMGRHGYYGPMSPPSHGPHRYVFQVFALDRALRTDLALDRKSLLREMDGKVLARGRLIGTFERK